MMPLAYAKMHETNVIKKINGLPKIKKHLENLGFVVGGEIVIVNAMNGDLIVQVKDSRIAISKDMASKIMI